MVVISDFISLLSELLKLFVAFARRSANTVAHTLAILSLVFRRGVLSLLTFFLMFGSLISSNETSLNFFFKWKVRGIQYKHWIYIKVVGA